MRRCSTSGVARMNIAIGKEKRVARGYNFSKCKGILWQTRGCFARDKRKKIVDWELTCLISR
jgi:hypothetical protein